MNHPSAWMAVVAGKRRRCSGCSGGSSGGKELARADSREGAKRASAAKKRGR
jgi:hypothetical protein